MRTNRRRFLIGNDPPTGGDPRPIAFLLAWRTRNDLAKRCPMPRWIMLGLTILGFALVFIAKSPGLLGLGLLLGIVGMIGFVSAIAAERISASARPDAAMASVEDLVALKERPTSSAAPLAQHPRVGPPADVRDSNGPNRAS